MWIQTGVTVWKGLSWVVTSVTLTFDLWSRPFAWTSLLSLVITPENFIWYDDGNIVKNVRRMDGQTDRQTDWTIHRAAWSQLKNIHPELYMLYNRHDKMPYFSRFIAKSWLNDLQDIDRGQRSLHATHPLMLVIICAKYGKNPSRTVHAVEQTRQNVPYFSHFIAKSWLNDLEDIGQGQQGVQRTTTPLSP